jgi:hypothetical protein
MSPPLIAMATSAQPLNIKRILGYRTTFPNDCWLEVHLPHTYFLVSLTAKKISLDEFSVCGAKVQQLLPL